MSLYSNGFPHQSSFHFGLGKTSGFIPTNFSSEMTPDPHTGVTVFLNVI